MSISLKVFCSVAASFMGLTLATSLSSENAEYMCYVCSASVEQAVESKQNSLVDACRAILPKEGSYLCDELSAALVGKEVGAALDRAYQVSNHREVCEELHICERYTAYPLPSAASGTPTALDIRVTKAYGSRGYDQLRLSVISTGAAVKSPLFSYSERFQYRWTDFFLSTGIVAVKPGEITSFTFANETVDLFVPEENQGIRGAIFADPCFSNEFVWCTYGEKFNMLNRSTELLNAVNAHDDVNFWMVLGDNWYDQSGEPTAQWWSMLSQQTKSKVYASVPGNHDFWILSAPVVWMRRKDQLGFGFMQHNAMDTAAAVQPAQVESGSPFDFSVDPDAEDATAHSLPPASNFFSYYKMGNVGFIAYSGGHSYEESIPFFEDACRSMSSDSGVQAVVLLGHWNTPGLGCPSDMNVPRTYRQIIDSIDACADVAPKMRYIMGHLHCNVVYEEDIGFMVAGQGMTSSLPCQGSYGMPVLDTTNGTFSIYYFPIQQWVTDFVPEGYDNYDEILQCISENGVSGCYHLATEWTSKPLE